MVNSVQGVVGFTEIPLSSCCEMFEDPENWKSHRECEEGDLQVVLQLDNCREREWEREKQRWRCTL